MSIVRPLLRGRRVLLIGRSMEQGSLALGSFVLASSLGVDGFAPIGVLLVFHSFAQSFADHGLALRVLAAPEGAPSSLDQLRRVVTRNAVVAPVLAVAVSLVTDVSLAAALGAALLWIVAGIATALRASELKAGRPAILFAGDSAAAITILAGAGIAALQRDDATLIVVATLVLRHAIDAGLCRQGARELMLGRPAAPIGAVVLSQLLAFAVANVDYVLVGVLLGGDALAVYLIAFRAASALPAQLAAVTSRTALVDFSTGAVAERQHAYERYLTRLMAVGFAGGLATAAAAPLLVVVLGDEWDAAGSLIIILAVAIPFRLVTGIAGGLFLVVDRTSELVRVESARLVIYSVAIAAATRWGLTEVTVALVCADVAATVVLHRLGARRAELVTPTWLLWSPAVAGAGLFVAVGIG